MPYARKFTAENHQILKGDQKEFYLPRFAMKASGHVSCYHGAGPDHSVSVVAGKRLARGYAVKGVATSEESYS